MKVLKIKNNEKIRENREVIEIIIRIELQYYEEKEINKYITKERRLNVNEIEGHSKAQSENIRTRISKQSG